VVGILLGKYSGGFVGQILGILVGGEDGYDSIEGVLEGKIVGF